MRIVPEVFKLLFSVLVWAWLRSLGLDCESSPGCYLIPDSGVQITERE